MSKALTEVLKYSACCAIIAFCESSGEVLENKQIVKSVACSLAAACAIVQAKHFIGLATEVVLPATGKLLKSIAKTVGANKS